MLRLKPSWAFCRRSAHSPIVFPHPPSGIITLHEVGSLQNRYIWLFLGERPVSFAEIWQYVVQIHQTVAWNSLAIVYGGAIVALYLFISQIRRSRLARTGNAIREEAEEIKQELQRLRERQMKLAKYTKGKVDKCSRETEERIDQFGRRLGNVEDRIPNLYDHMDEFRESLSQIFESELGSVMRSFDTSVDSVLQQMKDQLQTGVKNIEGIERMVRGRRKVETKLLGPSDAEEEVAPDEFADDAVEAEEDFEASFMAEDADESVELEDAFEDAPAAEDDAVEVSDDADDEELDAAA